ncbi:hypothetical protein PNEG_04273 [Pneumocystis murina B123]|uniref:Cysteine proteinase 1, mitochondrial n=1 Tax=Pneumocystis murina (strain B123) TaxID=1069680 RepID=A0A0W4ZX21_PNEMU|nr:hypothetical protein PNEG_04273 [Pneumocystis murina B123]KTW32920.1 hypothetical protein PNEG_04273 [Pneumocystis murina B123]
MAIEKYDIPINSQESSDELCKKFEKTLNLKTEYLIISAIQTNIFAEWEKKFLFCPKNRLALSAVSNGDLSSIIFQREAAILNNNHVYSDKIELEGSPVTYQRKSGRCWLFAVTNVIRVEFMKKYNLSEFEFSQAYLFFYDKLEKANYFLENILKTSEEALDSRIVSFLLSEPINDGGQYDMVVNLLNKYGLVPKHVYPDAYNAKDSVSLNRIIKMKLREYALILRSLVAKNATTTTISSFRAKMIEEIYVILAISLGIPPKPDDEFTWLYVDKDNKVNSYKTTPKLFYREFSQFKGDEYISLINDPRNEYGKMYTVDMLSNMAGGIGVRYLNTKMETLKEVAIKMIKENRPVFFGADSGKYIDRQSGIFDTALFNYELAFNVKSNLSKADRLRVGESLMTHAMVITAVHIEDGKPVKWRVQNSWGEDVGQKGWFMMTDEWMTEFVYQIVCHHSDLSEELQSVIKQVPIVLPPWDPMGSLARV